MKSLREVKDKLGQLLGIGCEGRCDSCCFNSSECLQPLIGDTLEHICTLERIRATQASTITSLRDAVSKQQLAQSRMQEEISRLEYQIPRWIPVEERLPEGEVLAANFKPGTYGYTDLIIGYVTSTEQGCFAENEHEILNSVTHWMPLPEPSEEAKTNG